MVGTTPGGCLYLCGSVNQEKVVDAEEAAVTNELIAVPYLRYVQGTEDIPLQDACIMAVGAGVIQTQADWELLLENKLRRPESAVK